SRLSNARGRFTLKYFQYLAVLFTEIFLDRLTQDPKALLRELNNTVVNIRQTSATLRTFPYFEADNLRRLVFFMATGSGKTLLLHINLWQIFYYLENGLHPEALVKRADGRTEFDNIILITPGDGLSAQHLRDFAESGIDASLFVEDRDGIGLFGPKVKVIEIHKLAEERSKDGVSLLIDEIGPYNLVFVDEGHKGTGSEARTWKGRQQKLSENGFLFEYSATFAQAIAAVGPKARTALLEEYGKSIIFDFSYSHFFTDGYGKNFKVLNLSKAREEHAQELMLGGLLTYFHQISLFLKHRRKYHPFNIERPLWVLLGTSVSRKRGAERDSNKAAKTERTDVVRVLAFIKRFLEEPEWAANTIETILNSDSGFRDQETGGDLFASHIPHILGQDARRVYKEISRDIFHGGGGLEVWELKNADGELGLRTSTGKGKESPYFGVINIGDVASFKKLIKEQLETEVQADSFSKSQFEEIQRPDSRINILIGAKKFIEGWSSWRVSSMGLMNVGKGEGSQIIQLFGRGVRLKGKNMALKRTEALLDVTLKPAGIGYLETLYIFGWNADFVGRFKDYIEQENAGKDFYLETRLMDPWPILPIPVPDDDFDVKDRTWTLEATWPFVSIDLTPKLTTLTSDGYEATIQESSAEYRTLADFKKSDISNLLDMDSLYTDLVEYKNLRTREGPGVFIPRSVLREVLQSSTLYLKEDDVHNPQQLNHGARQILRTYFERFLNGKIREAESQHTRPGRLADRWKEKAVTHAYRLTVKPGAFLDQIEALLLRGDEVYRETSLRHLPRLHFDRHLFNPVLRDGGKEWRKHVSVTPPAIVKNEIRLIEDMRVFWHKNQNDEPYKEYEIFLLRNLPNAGIGLFSRAGFYPDFILWVKLRKRKSIRVCFLEPHGLHHGGLSGNEDRFAALSQLRALNKIKSFQDKGLMLDGFMLTRTPLSEIVDAAGLSQGEIEEKYPLLWQEGDYIKKILTSK
ncbi:MAG: DEAD/DEAH box helicase family protein, partial [Desulfobacteraceae bacterium]|nr:DEAD/DEAH box helicase family protein [Desulfobacteraceae bacterium]